MNIRQVMKSPVITVKPRDSALHARVVLEKHRINHLPVVVDGRLAGIVSDRDLRDAFVAVLPIYGRKPGRVLQDDPDRVEVDLLMSRNVLTLEPNDTVDCAARLMRRERIGAVPIVEGTKLVGIVTRSDILDAFVRLAEEAPANARDATAPPTASDAVSRDW